MIEMPYLNGFAKMKQIQALFGSLTWRHHGGGMLQAYLPELKTGQHAGVPRLHVWHPSLLLPGMVHGGAMHDHRFNFKSTVLAGLLLHSRLTVRPSYSGGWSMCRSSRRCASPIASWCPPCSVFLSSPRWGRDLSCARSWQAANHVS